MARATVRFANGAAADFAAKCHETSPRPLPQGRGVNVPSNNMRTVRATRGERVAPGRSRTEVKSTYVKSTAWRPSDARALEAQR